MQRTAKRRHHCRTRRLLTVSSLGLALVGWAGVMSPGAQASTTYTKGFWMEGGYDIAIGRDGSAYITGSASRDFQATHGAYDETSNGATDAFVARIDPTGRLVYATFLGGSYSDTGDALTVDADGAVYVSGSTQSPDFPTTRGALDDSYQTNLDGSTGFVAKLSPDGTSVEYSTRLPGVRYVQDIAVDDAGSAHLTGEAYPDFPATADAFDLSFSGDSEGYLATLDRTGSRFLQASFLGGGNSDWPLQLELGSDGSTYIAGRTGSSDFPVTTASLDTTFEGRYDGFVSRVDPSGQRMLWSTFIGGSQPFEGEDEVTGLDLDKDGSVYLTGKSDTTDFPTTPGALYPDPPGHPLGDSWVARLNETGSELLFSTFLPAVLFEPHLDRHGNVHVTGAKPMAGFPQPGDTSDNPIAVELDGEGRLVTSAHLTDQYPWDFDADPAGTLYVLGPPLDSGATPAGRSTTTGETSSFAVAGSTSLSSTRSNVSRHARCTITGTPDDDVLEGTPGPDVICARGGNDVVHGRGGYDILLLGRGDDRAYAGWGIDVIDGGPGIDTAEGGGDRDLLVGGGGADTLLGGPGNDTLVGQDGADRLRGGDGRDRVQGGDGRDEEHGGAGADLIGGGAGPDRLHGGVGRDSVTGGSGTDRLDGGPARDRCRGGTGVDRLVRCEI